MVLSGPDDLAEVQLLDDDMSSSWQETSTAERQPGSWWKWFLALAAVIGVIGIGGIGGSILSDDADEEEVAAEPIVEPEADDELTPVGVEEHPDEITSRNDDVHPGDATPSLTPDGVPEGVVGRFDGLSELPEFVEPPGIPEGTVLVGHTTNGMAAIESDGSIIDVLPRDAARFLPQARGASTVAGTRTFTGEWFIVDGNGIVNRALVDDDDGPLFFAASDGEGYVVHHKRSGLVVYLSPAGGLVGEGPTLVTGTEIVGDSVLGLVVLTADRDALVLGHDDGSVVRELEGLPMQVGASRYIATRCDGGTSCRVVVASIIDDSELVLPVEADVAARQIVGLSPGGGLVGFRDGRTVVFVDTTTESTVLVYPGPALGGHSFLGDRYVLVWEPDGTLMSGDAVSGLFGHVTHSGFIDPGFRGIRLLLDS